MQDLGDKLRELELRIAAALERLDIAANEAELKDLEKASQAPDLWQDASRARGVMLRLTELQKKVREWRELEKQVKDLRELIALSAEDSSLREELKTELGDLGDRLSQKEFELSLAGRYDAEDAILTIHAGAGGTESQDWAEMLLRMYLRYAERRGYPTEVLDRSPGEEAGLKSVTISVSGRYAYGYLRSEHGVHRLVRLSPFDADHGRHTSFALVEAMPAVKSDSEVQLAPEDLKIEVFRSSGPGGQHMQKTSTAVRITHLPTGLTVSCQNERSQLQNKETAMKILRARLLKVRLAEQEAARAKLKGERLSAEWGSQIRSYILHPYKLVKDHRTSFETSDTDSVLDGELDAFIDSYLRYNMGRYA
ncbi:MAG: peptide chain release factor 2 [Chloroflexota bacterium]